MPPNAKSSSTARADRATPQRVRVVYPLDYGYLKGTSSMDGGGIDLWLGSQPGLPLTGIIVTVDLAKRDSEIKLLLGLNEAEIAQVLAFHNESATMKGLLIRREEGL